LAGNHKFSGKPTLAFFGIRLALKTLQSSGKSIMNAISAVHSQAIFHRHTAAQTQPPVQASDNSQVTNPARSARATLIDRPDLSSKSFGSLVSLFAQGLPLPPFENTDPAAPSPEAETVETPKDPPASDI
jgi:hypothetical protein